jgi:hypothetical protein
MNLGIPRSEVLNSNVTAGWPRSRRFPALRWLLFLLNFEVSGDPLHAVPIPNSQLKFSVTFQELDKERTYWLRLGTH